MGNLPDWLAIELALLPVVVVTIVGVVKLWGQQNAQSEELKGKFRAMEKWQEQHQHESEMLHARVAKIEAGINRILGYLSRDNGPGAG